MTKDHTLISGADFDVSLFHEIRGYDPFQLNLEICIRYLHTIEQMIGSLLLTQYQVLVLQRLTANVLRQSAFILDMETYIHENKLRYRAEKMSCHLLKLASKFDCITDNLYIAMYFYKKLRYMETLSIIEMIKVRLEHPYVMFKSNVDKEGYTEAVGGQSLSTKMRQAVAEEITLDNGIHKISEMVPEQQSALQNHFPVLFIPPYILLYMLEILCYRNVDAMRVQTALHDLQTLVHSDQGQLIPLDHRDISWQIQGICQQVTGNLQAALYILIPTISQTRNGPQNTHSYRNEKKQDL